MRPRNWQSMLKVWEEPRRCPTKPLKPYVIVCKSLEVAANAPRPAPCARDHKVSGSCAFYRTIRPGPLAKLRCGHNWDIYGQRGLECGQRRLTRIAKAFMLPIATLQWIVTAYLLVITGILPVAGRIADWLGRRDVFYLASPFSH